MSPPVKRAYDGSRRAQQAEELRRHIVDTAKPLFVAHGYENTSMRQLADAAGVSLQTLYNAFESKFGVFSRVMEVTVAGDHEPVALADRPESRSLAEIPDAATYIATVVNQAMHILTRLAEMYVVTRNALSDPQVAASHQRYTIEARYEDMRGIATGLLHTTGVRASLTVDHAADVIWTVLAPETHDLLVTRRQWTPAEFAAWATATLCADFLA